MAVLLILSAIALGLAASVQSEARIDAADWDGIQAEQLARSGQEFAAFLEARGLRKTPDFMAGLPFEAVTPGFHYRAQLPSGTVEIYFEADSGKLDLSNAPPEVLTNFFASWSGDFTNAQLITAAIEDWRDPDNDVRANGAEAPYYAPLNYAPRNGVLGQADAPLIRGLSINDFQLKPSQQNGAAVLRSSLDVYVTAAGSGGQINPNFAPELVLRSVPGLNESQTETILLRRADRLFDDPNDFQSRTGLINSPALRYFTLFRNTPAISAIAALKSGGITRSERRVTYNFMGFNMSTGILESKFALGRVQRNAIP
jgi:type II secretory pathway component PulK